MFLHGFAFVVVGDWFVGEGLAVETSGESNLLQFVVIAGGEYFHIGL
jgi:hypothetical protein